MCSKLDITMIIPVAVFNLWHYSYIPLKLQAPLTASNLSEDAMMMMTFITVSSLLICLAHVEAQGIFVVFPAEGLRVKVRGKAFFHFLWPQRVLMT